LFIPKVSLNTSLTESLGGPEVARAPGLASPGGDPLPLWGHPQRFAAQDPAGTAGPRREGLM